MKRIRYLFPVLLICLLTSSVQAQTHIYVKIIDNTDVTLTAGLSQDGQIMDGNRTVNLTDYDEVTSLQFDQEKPIVIGSQGSGSTTGPIKFNLLTITKFVDVASSKLMQAQAKGTFIKTVEILFVSATGGSPSNGVSHKIVLKKAAVKSYSASVSTDVDATSDSISFDYGVVQVYTYTQNPATRQYVENPYHYGWDRINNASAQ